MKVILFGASGMVGQGVLRECLLDPAVEKVLSIGRTEMDQQNPTLVQRIHRDFLDLSPLRAELAGFDACFYCLGVSSAGMNEAAYARVTFDFTMEAAGVLAPLNPQLTFIYVSGSGTDSTEKGRTMWARVKGRTENALLRIFPNAYMFRPALIQPLHGIRSKTKLYQAFYDVASPILPLLRRRLPNAVTTTEQIGRAMLRVAREGFATHILESRQINEL